MKPRIFVSSTFYDLKYIREDLSNFIKAHDFEPIMFEENDIGYTPGKPLDESCYESMRSADMVLLIIGGQYGSPAGGETEDKFKEYISITRNEFRTAVENGIPIFSFIDSKVYAEYGVYESNIQKIENRELEIIFKAVKNINVFRFIREIKNLSDISIIEFDKVIQIKEFLSKQWSDMFKSYLDILKNRKKDEKLEDTVEGMKALIKRMDTMLDGIGKRVLDKNEDINYSDVVQQIEIDNICDMLASSLRTEEFIEGNKEENVNLYLEAVKETLKILEEGDTEDRMKIGHKIFYAEINKRGANVCSYRNAIFYNLDTLKKLTNNNIFNAVKKKLLEDSYYNQIFSPGFL